MSTTAADIPRPYVDRPTVANNGSIHPGGTPLSTPYLDGPTPAQQAECAPWRAEVAVEMLSAAFLHRPAALPLIREVFTPLILLMTGIQVLAVIDDDPATGSLPLLIVLILACLIALYISYWQWKSSRVHVRAATVWARSAPMPRRSWDHHGGPRTSSIGTGAPDDDAVRRGGPSAIGQWLRAALPRRLPGLVWAVLAPSVVTSLVRAYAPAPFQDSARLAGTVLVLSVVLGGLLSNIVLSMRLRRVRSLIGLTGLEADPWNLAQRFTDDPMVLPKDEPVMPRSSGAGAVCARFAGTRTRPNRSGLVDVTLLDTQVALLPKAAADIAGPGTSWAGRSREGAVGDVIRVRTALANLLDSARAVARYGQHAFDVGVLFTAAMILYVGARPWVSGDALAWRTATPVVLSATAALLGTAILGSELPAFIDGAVAERLHLRALRAWADSCRLHPAHDSTLPAWIREGLWRRVRHQSVRAGLWGMGLWMLILLTVGLLVVGCSAGETPASLGRSVRFLTVATLRSWGLGDAELGLLLAIGLGVWAFTVLGRLRWGRQIGRLEHELLADGLARVGADGLVVIGEAGAPLSSLSSLSALGSTAVLEAPDEALMAGPGAWAAVTSAASTGVVTPWECGVAVERLSRLAADRHRSSSGGWLPLHAGLLFVVLAAARLGAGLGWILGVLVAVLGGLMMIGGSLSFLRDVGYDARLRRALMSWAREACGPWIWPGARGQDGDSSGSALAAWWAVDGSAKPASFFLIMGETAVLWWLLLPTGGALDAAAMILMGLPLLAWLVGVVKLMPLAAGAHRARMAVGLPGKWRVQDHVQEHAGMDGRTTTTIPGWRVLGMPTSTMGGGGWGRGW